MNQTELHAVDPIFCVAADRVVPKAGYLCPSLRPFRRPDREDVNAGPGDIVRRLHRRTISESRLRIRCRARVFRADERNIRFRGQPQSLARAVDRESRLYRDHGGILRRYARRDGYPKAMGDALADGATETLSPGEGCCLLLVEVFGGEETTVEEV